MEENNWNHLTAQRLHLTEDRANENIHRASKKAEKFKRNLVHINLIIPGLDWESLVNDIPAGDGKIANLFFQCIGYNFPKGNMWLLYLLANFPFPHKNFAQDRFGIFFNEKSIFSTIFLLTYSTEGSEQVQRIMRLKSNLQKVSEVFYCRVEHLSLSHALSTCSKVADPHWFYASPDPAHFFVNADWDPDLTGKFNSFLYSILSALIVILSTFFLG